MINKYFMFMEELKQKIENKLEKSRKSLTTHYCWLVWDFQYGINIRNLHNIIFASPSKSRIRNLQSIGRGLRLKDNKSKATLYDIADDLTFTRIKKITHCPF